MKKYIFVRNNYFNIISIDNAFKKKIPKNVLGLYHCKYYCFLFVIFKVYNPLFSDVSGNHLGRGYKKGK